MCHSVLLALALGAGATPAYAGADPRPVDPFVPERTVADEETYYAVSLARLD